MKQKFSASFTIGLQGIKQLFQRLGFLLNALSFLQLLKIPNKFTQFEKLRNFTGRLNSKISVTCTSCRSCQQLRIIFSSKTHRISIRLHMEDHNIPFSLFIILVYILSVLVLWNMFSNGHVTVTSCLFLQFNPSGLMCLPKKNCLGLVWKAEKVLKCSFKCSIFCSFHIPKCSVMKWIGQICKYFLLYIIFQSFWNNS